MPFYSWEFFHGGLIEPYCNSDGNSLHYNGQLARSYLSTLEHHITADTFVQFELITTCGSVAPLPYYITIEYSKDGGVSWNIISMAQAGFLNQQL